MSFCAPGMATPNTALYVPNGKGLYAGGVPGNISSMMMPVGTTFGAIADTGSVTLGVGGAVSTLNSQPQNVLRITGANGVGFIQGSNIGFSMPYSGNVGVRILPSTNAINVNNLGFVSTISPIGTGGVGIKGTINMTELTSSIKGYGWATVLNYS